MARVLWVDASAGVAGDMLAGALVDAGVPIDIMREAVDSVIPGMVTLTSTAVARAGLAATKFDVTVVEADAPQRHLSTIRSLLDDSGLDLAVRGQVLRVFTRLAEAEAAAHGVSIDEVHFHEVGAADSIADVVAVCAALHWLKIEELRFSVLELGHGSVQAAHGRLPVPTPAALRLSAGCVVTSDHSGECATPTGLALLTALGEQSGLHSLRVARTGVGAGSKDPSDHPNVVRVVVGDAAREQLLLEANVDDMDPRLWPGALEAILQAGARDAWLTPIVMKKGRPAHTLSVLCTDDTRTAVEEAVFRNTTTIGLRVLDIEKVALDRGFASVEVRGHQIAVKYAGRLGRIYNVSIEWNDVAAAAALLGIPERDLLTEAQEAAAVAGYVDGATLP